MKATKLSVGFREWDKLDDFLEAVNTQPELLGYAIDYTTALLVAPTADDLAWVEEQAAKWFKDYETNKIK